MKTFTLIADLIAELTPWLMPTTPRAPAKALSPSPIEKPPGLLSVTVYVSVTLLSVLNELVGLLLFESLVAVTEALSLAIIPLLSAVLCVLLSLWLLLSVLLELLVLLSTDATPPLLAPAPAGPSAPA